MGTEKNNILEERGFISKYVLYIVISLFFSVILLLVYAPVIQKDIFYQDDYGSIYGAAGEPASSRDQAIIEGRPTNAFLLFHMYSYVRSSESVKIIRLIGIIGMVLFATVMWAILKLSRFRSDHALLMSALICTLPSSQMYILWIAIVTYIYSALFSSLSALIVFNLMCKKEKRGKIYELIGGLTAIILLVTSLTIHQSVAMMYWAAGIMLFLTWDNYDFVRENRRSLLIYFFVGLVSIGIYYIVFLKIVPSAMNISIDRGAVIPIHIFPFKLISFLKMPFKNAINLWNVYPTKLFAGFISVIIFFGVIFSSLQETKEKKKFPASGFLQKYFLISCLIILSYLPSLVVWESAFTYRTLLPLASALSVLFCSGLINIAGYSRLTSRFSLETGKIIVTVLLSALLIFTAVLARYNATHWQSPAQLDMQLWEKWKIT